MEEKTKKKPTERQRHFTIQEVQKVLHYLNYGTISADLGKSAKHRFITRYGSGNYKTAVDGKTLLFKTKIVVTEDLADELMTKLYKDPATMGTSRDNFFSRIYQTYYGISRRQVQDFLMKQPSYQVHRRVRKGRVVKPIISKRVNSHWQMDIFAMADPKLCMSIMGTVQCLLS